MFFFSNYARHNKFSFLDSSSYNSLQTRHEVENSQIDRKLMAVSTAILASMTATKRNRKVNQNKKKFPTIY